jgi:thiol-disulfide isomerase/thioredoxin
LKESRQKLSAHRPERVAAATTEKLAQAEASLVAAVQSAMFEKPLQALLHPEQGQVETVHSAEDLDNCLQGSPAGLAVLEVTTTYCRACKGFAPKYNKVAADPDYKGKVSFMKVVLNENPETRQFCKERFGTKLTPAFYFFKDGEIIGERTGTSEMRLRSDLNELMLPERVLDEEPSTDDY